MRPYDARKVPEARTGEDFLLRRILVFDLYYRIGYKRFSYLLDPNGFPCLLDPKGFCIFEFWRERESSPPARPTTTMTDRISIDIGHGV